MIPGGGGGGASLEWKFSQVFGERAAGEEIQEGKETTVKFNFNCSQLCPFTPSVPAYSADKYLGVLINEGQASGYRVELAKCKLTKIYQMKYVNGFVSLLHLKIFAL